MFAESIGLGLCGRVEMNDVFSFFLCEGALFGIFGAGNNWVIRFFTFVKNP